MVVAGLDLPWSMVRLENGSTLVSERDTALVKEIEADGHVRTVGRVPGVVPGGEGGLLGLAVAPGGVGDQKTLYAYTTARVDNRIVRMPLTGKAGALGLGRARTVFGGIPKGIIHDGGRIKFGPDGMLYVTTGEAGRSEVSQDRTVLGGKILRITRDGGIPPDNPFPHSPVYSLGHRNPQGIAWDDDGKLWAAEFGQNTWDELNAIEPGKNYGWPVVEGKAGDAEFVDPVQQWATADASPSGLLYSGGRFYLAALRGERLWVITATSRTQATSRAYLTHEYGRLRDVIDGPPGTLWVLTSNSGAAGRNGDKLLEVPVPS